MTSIPVPIRKLDSISFDRLLCQQNPFGSAVPTFDLTGIELVTPCALVQLAAACYALAHAGRMPTIVVDDVNVCTYLMRARFIQVVEPVAQFVPDVSSTSHAYDGLQGASSVLIEITPIESGQQLSDLLDRIITVLRDRLLYPKYDAFDVAMAVSEICQNTLDHNAQACGFLAMQAYSGRTNRFLEIGVADYGNGLTASLQRNPKNPSMLTDQQAIELATELGSSEYDDITRGTGLYHLLEIAYRHCGSVQIRSGAAKMRYRMDQRRGWGFIVQPMPGVHIAFTLPAKGTA